MARTSPSPSYPMFPEDAAPLSADGSEPATHYWSTGYWFNDELDRIVNDVTWPRTVRFGDAQTALADMGLQQVQMVEPISEE